MNLKNQEKSSLNMSENKFPTLMNKKESHLRSWPTTQHPRIQQELFVLKTTYLLPYLQNSLLYIQLYVDTLLEST